MYRHKSDSWAGSLGHNFLLDQFVLVKPTIFLHFSAFCKVMLPHRDDVVPVKGLAVRLPSLPLLLSTTAIFPPLLDCSIGGLLVIPASLGEIYWHPTGPHRPVLWSFYPVLFRHEWKNFWFSFLAGWNWNGILCTRTFVTCKTRFQWLDRLVSFIFCVFVSRVSINGWYLDRITDPI